MCFFSYFYGIFNFRCLVNSQIDGAVAAPSELVHKLVLVVYGQWIQVVCEVAANCCLVRLQLGAVGVQQAGGNEAESAKELVRVGARRYTRRIYKHCKYSITLIRITSVTFAIQIFCLLLFLLVDLKKL